MLKAKSISLVLIMVLLILPWHLFHVCLAHPFGHSHDHIPCAERTMHRDDSIWPPMDCIDLFVEADDFPPIQKTQLKPVVQTLVLAAAICDLICFPKEEKFFVLPPEPQCRSAPLIAAHSLRGPPSC